MGERSTFRGEALPHGLSYETAARAETAIAEWEWSHGQNHELVFELFSIFKNLEAQKPPATLETSCGASSAPSS